MSTAPASPNQQKPGLGLPPVAPPTAGSFVQLFVTPLLIVILLVGVAWGFHYFFGLLFGTPSAAEFLKRLDDPNAEVRWRAAADLGQVLLRPNNGLSTDPDFALKLADRLAKAHANSAQAEKAFAGRVAGLSKDDAERERKKLEGERNYVHYLSACVGNFVVPVGAPVLQELAAQDADLEPKALYEQRAAAILALAVLGEKCKGFDDLTPVEQDNILARLEEAAERREHAEWAEQARDYLKARQAKRSVTMGVDKTLIRCADAPQPYLRELTALALNFWSGTDAENERIEEALEKLSNDPGAGEEEQRQLVGDNPEGTTAFTKPLGRQVCYNATNALARRGSTRTRTGVLEEMLDEGKLRDTFRLRNKNGTDEPDNAAAVQTVLVALKAVAEMHRRNPKLVNDALREAVNKLTSNQNAAVANEAKQTKQVLDTGN
jgi:hypothetical protein